MSAVAEEVGSLVTIRNLEWLKWLGFGCMIIDHIGFYVFGVIHPVAEAFGALALPLFAVALGAGIAWNPEIWVRVAFRMLRFAFAAQIAVMLVRGPFPLTIISTLFCGLGIFIWAHAEEPLLKKIGAIALLSFVGVFTEFTLVGVAFVTFTLAAVRYGTLVWVVPWWLLLAALTPFNGNLWAFAVLPIIVFVSMFPSDLGRIRGVFYWLYVVQYPILWVARRTFV